VILHFQSLVLAAILATSNLSLVFITPRTPSHKPLTTILEERITTRHPGDAGRYTLVMRDADDYLSVITISQEYGFNPTSHRSDKHQYVYYLIDQIDACRDHSKKISDVNHSLKRITSHDILTPKIMCTKSFNERDRIPTIDSLVGILWKASEPY
jgi:hypothetical protein